MTTGQGIRIGYARNMYHKFRCRVRSHELMLSVTSYRSSHFKLYQGYNSDYVIRTVNKSYFLYPIIHKPLWNNDNITFRNG